MRVERIPLSNLTNNLENVVKPPKNKPNKRNRKNVTQLELCNSENTLTSNPTIPEEELD